MPNLHPIFVHFTIGLLVIAFVFLLIGLRNSALKDKFNFAGLLCLWSGFLITLGTLTTGLIAFYTVAHTAADLHKMVEHRNWAIATAVLFIVLILWSIKLYKENTNPTKPFLALYALALISLIFTGREGGGLVYKHGIGVESKKIHNQH